MSGWLGAERDAAAADRILDAAGRVFASSGTESGMGDIARAAGCSRATVYRYFEDRHALRSAFVHRAAREIARDVAAGIGSFEDPTERLVEAVTRSIGAVRADPVLLAWFSAPNALVANEMAAESEVIAAIGAAFLDARRDDLSTGRVDDLLLRARWTVRVIVSLLAAPEAELSDERALLQRFLAPVVLDRSTAAAP